MPKVRYGDVFRLPVGNGYAFVQCVKEAPKNECEVIRILPGVYDEKDMERIEKIASERELFFSIIPVKYAVRRKFLRPIGNFSVPVGSDAPRFFKTQHIIGSEFIGWHIVDSKTCQMRLVKALSTEEKDLSERRQGTVLCLVNRIR